MKLPNVSSIVWLAVLGCLLIGANRPAEAADVSRPNVLFIIADDKYECPTRNAVSCRENADFSGIRLDLQVSLDCGRFSAIAGN